MAESIRTISPPFDLLPSKAVLNPSAREWQLHGALFVLTIISTLLAGTMLVLPDLPIVEPPLRTALDYIRYVPIAYFRSVSALISLVVAHPAILGGGFAFSISLLSILFSHEMGHYLACRYYGVHATLPYFIPAPPLFLAGTFGAFIKIRSPIPSRRALFDIGLAGPLAGFIVAVPVAVLGILAAQSPLPPSEGSQVIFNDPLLFRLLAKALGVTLDANTPINPYYMAGWIGLLVTSLNLMPVGQLDGGHGTFAVFGARAHSILGRVALIIVATLAVLGFWWHGSPSGFLYAILLAVMLRIRHPQPPQMEPLGLGRTAVAIITLIVFCLSFYPFPITLR
ncbi:MAG: site-2 protease family protein [Pyrinomonadaceae bacterium]